MTRLPLPDPNEALSFAPCGRRQPAAVPDAAGASRLLRRNGRAGWREGGGVSIAEKLDELIVAIKAASVPVDKRWVDAETGAGMLTVSKRTFLEEYAPRPDFPKPLREGQPRWKASEILQWADRRRDAGLRRGKRAA
jgi:predicted DNA-binding transcriptional regulator AlpA